MKALLSCLFRVYLESYDDRKEAAPIVRTARPCSLMKSYAASASYPGMGHCAGDGLAAPARKDPGAVTAMVAWRDDSTKLVQAVHPVVRSALATSTKPSADCSLH